MIVWVNKALDRDPEQLLAHELLAGAYWKMGDLERAQKHLQLAGELRSEGMAQREVGNAGLKFVRLVIHYAEAGDLDAAFEHLQHGLDAHDPALVHLAVAPQWDSLRADPLFHQCLVRMKLRSAPGPAAAGPRHLAN